MKEKIETEQAPKAIGPFSQGILIPEANLIFVSGQLPIDPKTSKLVEGGIRAITNQVLKNMEAILLAAGSNLQLVIRTDVFMKDMNDFSAMNEEYARYFEGPVFPARQTVQVAGLPLGAAIEISCIAIQERA